MCIVFVTTVAAGLEICIKICTVNLKELTNDKLHLVLFIMFNTHCTAAAAAKSTFLHLCRLFRVHKENLVAVVI